MEFNEETNTENMEHAAMEAISVVKIMCAIMNDEEDNKAEEPEKVRKVSQVEGQPVRKVEIPADKYKVVSTK